MRQNKTRPACPLIGASGCVAEEVARTMRKGKLECEYRDIDRCDRMVAACAIGDVDLGQEIVKIGLAFAYRCFSISYDLDE